MKFSRPHYSWVIVVLSIFVLATDIVIIYGFGIFLGPVTAAFGWDRGALSLALSITMLVGGVLGIIITGRMNDRYGPRFLVTLGGITAGTAYLLMSRVSAIWQVYLIWGFFLGIAYSCLTLPITSTIPRWFRKKRGLAQGLTMTGIGIGGIIWPPLVQWLISAYGWQQAYVTVGIITLVIIIPLAQFLKHSPQRMGLKPYGDDDSPTDKQAPPRPITGLTLNQVIKTPRFWTFGFISFAFLFSIQSIVVHIAPHAKDTGITAIIAATIPSIIAAVSLVGRVLMGLISDRLGPRSVLAICVTIFCFGLVWLLFTREIWMFYVFAVIIGLAYGGETAVMTLVPAELFGIKYLSTIVASTQFFGRVGASIGTPLAGAIFDSTGSYQLAFYIYLVLGALGVVLSLILLRSKPEKM